MIKPKNDTIEAVFWLISNFCCDQVDVSTAICSQTSFINAFSTMAQQGDKELMPTMVWLGSTFTRLFKDNPDQTLLTRYEIARICEIVDKCMSE